MRKERDGKYFIERLYPALHKIPRIKASIYPLPPQFPTF